MMSKDWSYSDDRKRIIIEPPTRTKKITGHRFPSVLGLNKYQTPFGAWCEITGMATIPFETNKYVEAGKAIEPKQIAYAKQFFPNIMSIEEYYGNSFSEYQYNNFKDLGRIFDGVRDLVSTKNDRKTIAMVGECKTSSKPQDWDNNNVPIDYLCQGMLYAYLDKLNDILFIASFLQPIDYNHPELFNVNATNTRFVVKKLNDCYLQLPTGEYGTIELAINYCEDWWEKHIKTGVSPEFDEELDKEYLDILRRNKPINDSDLDELVPQAIQLIDDIGLIKEQTGLSQKEKDLKTIEKAIKIIMTDKEYDFFGGYKLNRKTKQMFDEKRFASEQPNMYESYCVEQTEIKLTKDFKKEGEMD